MVLTINPYNPQDRLIQNVIKQLQGGAIICYPTDTGYGIGCDVFNQRAVKKLMQMKKRPKNKPFSFMCGDLKDISQYAHVSNIAYRLLKKNLPGPYTFVLPGSKLVPKIMATKQKTVGIKVPENKICQALIHALGNPIVNTSVQLGEDDEPLSDPFDIDLAIGNRVDIIIDGGPVYPDPSSVINLTTDHPEILREGKGDISSF